MNRRKIVLLAMLSMLGTAGIASAAYVRSTVSYYRENPTCGPFTGLPKMLVAVHLVDAQCKSSATGPHAPCQDKAACKVPGTSGNGKNGKCGAITPTECGCIPN
jgi:hypothetical protein